MKKLTTKALLTFLITICAVGFSVSNASNLSMNITNTLQYDTTCFAWFSYEKLGDGKIAFTDSSWVNEAQGDSAISWNWTFGDGTSSVLKNPIHIYTSTTEATVCLTVKTKLNISCTECREIQIQTDTTNSCTAEFGYSPMLSVDSLNFFFYDVSSGSSQIAWRQWSISDGSNYTDSAFVHAFDPNLKSADVCFTIGTESGCQASVCKNINLNTCIADFSYTSQNNGTVNFYNQSIVVVNSALWHWQFGDGTTSGQMNPVHTYAPGTTQAYVCLTVRTMKDSCTTCKYVYVQNTSDSCQADFAYNRIDSGSKTPQYRFTDVSLTDSHTTWRRWTISDSSSYTDSTFVHGFVYPTTNATVCLSIGTSSGCSSSICKTINITDTIVPTHCKANFSYSIARDSLISSPLLRTRVYFNDLSYSSDSIVTWIWYFGDGTSSRMRNPSHSYRFTNDTTVMVSLTIASFSGCIDSTVQFIFIPANNPLYSMSGTVEGKNELLPQGIMVLYKKADNGFFMLHDANIINNGLFSFEQLNAGKYLLYAMPHMYLSEKYYPTYYVNKLHWVNAQIIDLNSNIGGLTLKMVSTRILEKGMGVISGTVINNNETTQLKSTRLKSIMAGLSTPVYLYAPSGEVLSMSLTDESNAFGFEELPYGTYILKIESLNLPAYETTITISPETPEVNNIVFDLNNPLSIKDLNQSAKLTIKNVDNNNIALRMSKGGEYNITLVSLSGKTVINSTINLEANSDKVISLGAIPKGVYILKLQNKANSVVTKFLK